jgi:uncharacterized membrane protein
MIASSFWIVFYFTFPVLIIWLCLKYNWLDKIGAVLINYGFGLLIANLGILPENFNQVQDLLTTILIPIAIPLLLFTADINAWLKMVGKTSITFLLGVLALLIAVYSGYFIFKDPINELNSIAGMLVGVYTGGTPNLAAIKTALNVPADIFIITHTSDMFASLVYLVFILTIGQKVIWLILPKFNIKNYNIETIQADTIIEETQQFRHILKSEYRISLLKAFGLSVFIFIIGGGLSMFVPEKMAMLTAILAITTLAILFSTQKKVREIKNSFQLGMYLIHVFSLVVASMANISKFSAIESLDILMYVFFVVFLSVIIHLFLSYFFKIDTDTFIIVSISMIFSPPFVPIVAASLKNKYVIISGITAGIVGYAIGNYLGVFVALSLG